MSINRKFFTAIALAIAVFAMSAFVSAQETKSDAPTTKEGRSDKRFEGKRGDKGLKGEHGLYGKRGMHGGKGMMRSFRGIELTETQKTQIKAIFEANKNSFSAQHEEMKGLMMKKRDGSLTEVDLARLDQFKNERKASAEQMKVTIMALLTPEQTTKMNQMKAEREQRMQERKQRWQERKQLKEAPKDNK